ncbi:hypothetical protein FRC11_005504 [Ceratobasidium sp. 423]|nr:hypothetical protein FRC11_005504 [Ceratobasidium sp. 423]
MARLGPTSACDIIESGQSILQQESSLLRVPDKFLFLLPSFNVPVPDLLQFTFPPLDTRSSHTNSLSATRFHDCAPAQVDLDIIDHSVPDLSLCRSLWDDWRHASRDGSRSIFHVSNDGTAQYYPFWILTWWELVLRGRQKQDKWRTACNWLSRADSATNHSAASQIFTRAREYISHIGWDDAIPFEKRCSTADLSFFLSDDWLATRHIDWMLESGQLRWESHTQTEVHPLHPKTPVIFYSPEVLRGIIQRFETIPPSIAPGEIPRFLAPLQARIRDGERPRLYTVYNYADVHWLALEVDFNKRLIRYGDLMGGRKSSGHVRNTLKAWIKATWGYEDFMSEEMPSCTQVNDATSCGVCAINTIEVQVFEDRLWEEELAAAYRASKFIEVVHRVLHLNGAFNSIIAPVTIQSALTRPQNGSIDRDLLESQLISTQQDNWSDMPSLPSSPPPPSPLPSSAPPSSIGEFSEYDASDAYNEAKSDHLGDDIIEDASSHHESSPVESDSGSGSDSSSKSMQRPKKRQKPGKSAAHTRAVLEAVHTGSFEIDEDRVGAGPMAPKLRTPSTNPPQQDIQRVCPGISEEDIPGLSAYLLRTMYIGGGSRAYNHFAQALYSMPYMALSEEEQQKVQNEAHGNVAWRVDESRNVVVASSCTRIARGANTINDKLLPCENCVALLKLSGLKAAVRYEPKPNQKFTNKRWMKVASGMQFAKAHGVYEIIASKDEKTPAQRFLLRVLQGETKDRTVFCGMVEVIAMMDDKAYRGVGLQNAKYPPDFDQFCHEIVNISPLAYHTFRSMLGGRTASSFRAIRGRERRFPLAIDDSVYELAKSYLSSVGYGGPVSLGCDDTKLTPALKTYYDAGTKQWYLLGGTTGAIAIASTDELESILKKGKISKASKIRLWVLQVPLPHIPPLAIAALPIASNVTTQSLIGYLKLIVRGLLNQGIHVVSYAADGSAIEQNIQELFFMSMDRYRTYTIPHPSQRISPVSSPQQPLSFKLGLLEDKPTDDKSEDDEPQPRPCVVVQDDKHGLKTFRNNMYSGARLLVLGSETVMYSQVYEMVEDPTSTIHRRDVEHMDRQDDGSAEGLFNELTLEFVVQHRPKYLGLVLYLYVLGELSDAYQSRHISHADRLWMALRAKFFMDFWRQFLQASGYPLQRYFISQPASNILTTLIEGLILLIYAYRDYVEEGTPLLPWLHSTEACEHFFGEMRKLVPDFTYLDFIFAAPKLRVLLRASYRRSPESSESSTEHQKKATGYRHTYMDSTNVDLKLLACFPSDGEIAEIAYVAYREAVLLARAVNILPDDELPNPVPAPTATKEPEDEVELDTKGIPESTLSTSEAFQELVELADAHDLPLESVSIQRDNLIYANAALQAETAAFIDNLPPEDGADIECDRAALEEHAKSTSRMVDPDLTESRIKEMKNETFPQQRSTIELNLTALVQIRKRHQNPRALKSSKNYAKLMAARQAGTADLQPVGALPVQAKSKTATVGAPGGVSTAASYASLARSFLQTLSDHETAGHKVSSRLQRWIVSGGETDRQFTGNTANAKKAAEARANAYIKSRRDALRQRGIPRLLEELSTARITTIKPIKPGIFVWILSKRQIVLSRVMAIYIKEGGSNGMNLWVPHTSHLGHISYVAVQTYQKVSSRAKYRATHFGRSMEIPYYELVPTSELLMCVGFANTPSADAQEVELKDRTVIGERDELLRLLPELEKAGIPRVGAKTVTEP